MCLAVTLFVNDDLSSLSLNFLETGTDKRTVPFRSRLFQQTRKTTRVSGRGQWIWKKLSYSGKGTYS